jgi:tubulin-specific chaperone A
MERSTKRFSEKAASLAKKTGAFGLAVLTPLSLLAQQAIEFDDKMSDIQKTTGLAGAELNALGKDLRELSHGTRTSIPDLVTLAKIGGELGVRGRSDVLAFTDSINKFNVSLGADFTGGVEEAARAVGGLRLLFKETRDLKIDDAINRAGSAINALSAKGVRVPSLTEFAQRVGALPNAIKPSIQNTVALGAVLDKANISAEIGSRAIGDILQTAATNLPAFSKQVGLSQAALSDMINTDPTAFLMRFSKSLNGLSGTRFAALAKELKLVDSGSLKVIGALASSTDQLTEFQKIAHEEYAKGTSILDEYNVKNDTMAGRIQRAINSLIDLSITLGEKVVPAIGNFIDKVSPTINSIVDWVGKNETLVQGLLIGATIIGSLSLAVSTVSTVVSVVSGLTKVWTAAQWLLNVALNANPIGIIITVIGLLVAAIMWVVKNTEGWGKQWDATIDWMKSILRLWVLTAKLQFQTIGMAFMGMVDTLLTAWYWVQNQLGIISDEQYKKNLAQIDAEKKARIDAWTETQNAITREAAKVAAGPGMHISLLSDKQKTEEVPAAIVPPKFGGPAGKDGPNSPQEVHVVVSALPGTQAAEVSKGGLKMPWTSSTFTSKKS